MNLCIVILLTNLVTLAYSNAYYPPHFYLKGPTSQATIYGVDGSKIVSVADAGSISSDGIKGATVSSYSSGQSLEGSGSDEVVSPDCNCSKSGPGVVLQGPSMSATIIGPSGSVSTGGSAGGSSNKNYKVPHNNGHYGSGSVGTSTFGGAGENIGLPSVPSVNIQGPTAWGANVGPTFTSHSSYDGRNKGLEQATAGENTGQPSAPSVNIQGPSAWGTNIGPTYTSHSNFGGGNKINQQHLNRTPTSAGKGDKTVLPSLPSVNIKGPSAWGVNIGPTYTSHGNFGGSNQGIQQPGTTKTEPCDANSKGCGVNSLGTSYSSETPTPGHVSDNSAPSVPSINIKGPSAWGINVGPSHTSHSNVDGSNRGNQQPAGGKKTDLPSVLNVNMQGPSAWDTNVNPVYTSHSNFGGNNNENSYQTPTSAEIGGNTVLPSLPSVNIQGPSAWGMSVGPSYINNADIDGSNKGNQQPTVTVTKTCGSNSKNCDVNAFGTGHRSQTPTSGGNGVNTAIPIEPTVNIQGPSAWGTNIGPSYTSHGDVDGSNKGHQQSGGTITAGLENGKGVNFHTFSSSSSSYTYGSNQNGADSNNQKASATLSRPCGKFSKNCDVNSSDLSSDKEFNIQGPAASSSTISSNHSGSFDGNTASVNVQHSVITPTVTEHCNPSSKNCDVNSSSGVSGIAGTTAAGAFGSTSIKDTSYYTGSFENINANHHIPINTGTSSSSSTGTPNTYTHATGNDQHEKTSIKVQTSYGAPLINQFGQNAENKTSSTYNKGYFTGTSANTESPSGSSSYRGNYNKEHFSGTNTNTPSSLNLPVFKTQNIENVNTNQGIHNGQGFPTFSSRPTWHWQRSSTIEGPHHLGYNGGNSGYSTSSSYISPVYSKPSQVVSSSSFGSKTINSAKNNVAIPESSIGFNKQTNGYGTLKYQGHNLESSSLAPPTYVIPNNVPQLVSGVTQNQDFFDIFGFKRDGKGARDPKYDCYVIQLPANSYNSELSPGEYSELLKKISTFVHHHHHKHHLH